MTREKFKSSKTDYTMSISISLTKLTLYGQVMLGSYCIDWSNCPQSFVLMSYWSSVSRKIHIPLYQPTSFHIILKLIYFSNM